MRLSVTSLTSTDTSLPVPGKGDRRLLALASKERLIRILEKMLDEDEFFSDHGIRSCVVSMRIRYEQYLNLNSACRRDIKISHGVWTFMGSAMR